MPRIVRQFSGLNVYRVLIGRTTGHSSQVCNAIGCFCNVPHVQCCKLTVRSPPLLRVLHKQRKRLIGSALG